MSREILPEDIWNDEKRAAVRNFIDGHKSAGKEINKTLTDLKNKYKSWLHDAQHTKLTKTTSEEQLIALKAKIEVLEELENKLKK